MMTKKLFLRLAFLLVVPGLVLMVSCSKNVSGTGPNGMAGTTTGGHGSDTSVAGGSGYLQVDERYKHVAASDSFPGENIQFEFDSSRLVGKARENLRRKAQWLMAHPDVAIVIQGHCDERGMSAYNIALGDQRANRVKEYLTDLGVDSKRLTTISYGEEHPLDPGRNEEAWAKNRRVQFE